MRAQSRHPHSVGWKGPPKQLPADWVNGRSLATTGDSLGALRDGDRLCHPTPGGLHEQVTAPPPPFSSRPGPAVRRVRRLRPSPPLGHRAVMDNPVSAFSISKS